MEVSAVTKCLTQREYRYYHFFRLANRILEGFMIGRNILFSVVRRTDSAERRDHG